MHRPTTLLVAILLVATLPLAAADGGLGPKPYTANGIRTIWCDGTTGTGDHEDDPTVEPWCAPLNALNPGEESEIGGVEWDLYEEDLDRDYVFSIVDDNFDATFARLGLQTHSGGFYGDVQAGCGALEFYAPSDAPLDEDGDIDLIGEISIAHVNADTLESCFGSQGTATLSLA